MDLSLYNTYKSLILEAVDGRSVTQAIEDKRRINIYYDAPDNEASGRRTIDPYVYGLTKAGNPAIRAYQVFGDTGSEGQEWKLFRLDRITRWEPTKYIFKKPVSDIDPEIPGFNEMGDQKMMTIYKIAKFR